jgi:hypothetical protein
MRLPAAIERYDTGAPVSFGGLSVSQDELRVGRRLRADRVTVAGTAELSQAEISEVLGWPVETVTSPGTGGQAARFRGGGADLSLAIRKRHAADRAVTRLFGRAVPGIGEQAWLLSGDRTLVVLAGPTTVKLDLHGLPRSARADILIPLARLATARLVTPPGQ